MLKLWWEVQPELLMFWWECLGKGGCMMEDTGRLGQVLMFPNGTFKYFKGEERQ